MSELTDKTFIEALIELCEEHAQSWLFEAMEDEDDEAYKNTIEKILGGSAIEFAVCSQRKPYDQCDIDDDVETMIEMFNERRGVK